MSSTPDRLNRAMFTLFGLLLMAAGIYGLLRGYGVFGDTQAQESLLTGRITGFFGRTGDFLWPITAVVFLLIAYLAWRWLKAQLTGTPSVSDIDLTRDPAGGRTRLRTSGATTALARDIEADPAVRSAKARMLSDGQKPEVDVEVEVAEDADFDAVRRRIEEVAFARFAQAIEAPELAGHLRLGLAPGSGRSVR